MWSQNSKQRYYTHRKEDNRDSKRDSSQHSQTYNQQHHVDSVDLWVCV